jgi:hypothetical protein
MDWMEVSYFHFQGMEDLEVNNILSINSLFHLFYFLLEWSLIEKDII